MKISDYIPCLIIIYIGSDSNYESYYVFKSHYNIRKIYLKYHLSRSVKNKSYVEEVSLHTEIVSDILYDYLSSLPKNNRCYN